MLSLLLTAVLVVGSVSLQPRQEIFNTSDCSQRQPLPKPSLGNVSIDIPFSDSPLWILDEVQYYATTELGEDGFYYLRNPYIYTQDPDLKFGENATRVAGCMLVLQGVMLWDREVMLPEHSTMEDPQCHQFLGEDCISAMLNTARTEFASAVSDLDPLALGNDSTRTESLCRTLKSALQSGTRPANCEARVWSGLQPLGKFLNYSLWID
jgi:hypothetical protein